MSWRTTGGLLAAALLLGAFIWLLEYHVGPVGTARRELQPLLAEPLRSVSWIRVEGRGFRLECQRKGDEWHLQRPVEGRAEQGDIRRFLDVLDDLERVEVITPEQRRARDLTMTDYGLADPRARITLGNISSRVQMAVGTNSPVGDLTFVRLGSEEDVIATAARLGEVIPTGAGAWRDRVLLRGDAARVQRLEIQRPGQVFLQLARDEGGGWMLVQPQAARADSTKVDGMLERLFAAKARRFVWDPPMAEAEQPVPAPETMVSDATAASEPLGLLPESAPVRLRVWLRGVEAPLELVMGRECPDVPAEVYVKRGDAPSILTTGRALLDAFTVAGADLRERAVFSLSADRVRYAAFEDGDTKIAFVETSTNVWGLIEPVQWPADSAVVDAALKQLSRLEAQRFISESVVDYAAFGLQSPRRAVTLATLPPVALPASTPGATSAMKATGVVERLLIGNPMTNDAAFYARLESSPAVFALAQEAVGAMGLFPLDPLVFFDRQVLSVDPAAVRLIALTRGGREQSIMRTESGEWAPLMPGQRVLDPLHVDDLLLTIAGLRAVRIEARSPASLVSYGLDAPPIVLKIGLSAAQGIQKALNIGFRSGTEGVFAMVQGQHVVFVLPGDVVDRLSRDLIVPVVDDMPQK